MRWPRAALDLGQHQRRDQPPDPSSVDAEHSHPRRTLQIGTVRARNHTSGHVLRAALGVAPSAAQAPARSAARPKPVSRAYAKRLRCRRSRCDGLGHLLTGSPRRSAAPRRELDRQREAGGAARRAIGPRFMRARQRIYRAPGGTSPGGPAPGCGLSSPPVALLVEVLPCAPLRAVAVGSPGHRSARLHGPKDRVLPPRPGPHTRPWWRHPRRTSLPRLHTDRGRERDTLGTSVGWPHLSAEHPEQWIDVTGRPGCFAYVHTADPKNGV